MVDCIWTKMTEPGEDLLDVGQRRYEREEGVSYPNCTVAVLDEQVIGTLVAFTMHLEEDALQEGDPVLAPYNALEEDDSDYICGMALFPPYRGQGPGARFLELAENQAR